MNFKIRIKYIFFYLLFNITGCFTAIKYRTSDDLILSELNKYTLMFSFSIAICWIGIVLISMMISRDLLLKPDNFDFFSPYNFSIDNEYLSSKIGVTKEKKFMTVMGIISFLILISTIGSFIILINKYEKKQLNEYGIIETVKVKEINYNAKKNEFALFVYQNKKCRVNFFNDSLKINDTVKIIYSKKNPNIVKYLKEYQEK